MRYWPTVAPVVGRELRRWERPAQGIEDPQLRRLALEKLAHERFNAEVAATLATLAPRPARAGVTGAIVALELLFDYLDGRTEQPYEDPVAEGEELFVPFVDAVRGQVRAGAPPLAAGTQQGPDAPDSEYLRALSDHTQGLLQRQPAFAAVADVAHCAATRCAQAQVRLHAAATLGDEQLARWAGEHAEGSGLGWREYAGGCASSVLAVHALIAAAADPATNPADARALDSAYLAIGGVITMLDSLVDHSTDSARGEPGFIRLFESGEELSASASALTREALIRARRAPNGEHHVMTLAGVLAYYTSHPGAREPHARAAVHAVRAQLSPTIWPTLGVMFAWRAAKRARRILRPSSRRAPENAAPPRQQAI